MFESNSFRGISCVSQCYLFRKASFSSTLKRKAVVFNFLQFEERFRKAPFRDGLVWTGGLTVDIKLRFEISPAIQNIILKVLHHG